MELKDTVNAMLSDDYILRMSAEYWQLKIRRDKLSIMINAYENGKLSFVPKCSVNILKAQCAAMDAYLSILNERTELEGIDTYTGRKVE